jgi:hypothetical protein
LNFASLGVDDPIGHRLDTWGVGVGIRAACLPRLCVIHEYRIVNCSLVIGFLFLCAHILLYGEDKYSILGMIIALSN